MSELSTVIVTCRHCNTASEVGMEALYIATELCCTNCGERFERQLMMRIKNADRAHRIATLFQRDDIF